MVPNGPKTVGVVAAGLLGLFGWYVMSQQRRGVGPVMQLVHWLRSFRTRLVLRPTCLVVAETEPACVSGLERLATDLLHHRYVGFDCEWVSEGRRSRPVALLQLASPRGVVLLVRLCKIGHVPSPLKAFLQDETVLKVGVAPLDDAKLLCKDFGVEVRSCLDMRLLHSHSHSEAAQGPGLARLTHQVLGVTLDKNWKLRCSDWEQDVLSSSQVQYAAHDAVAAALVFAQLAEVAMSSSWLWRWVGLQSPSKPLEPPLHLKYQQLLDKRPRGKSSGGTPKAAPQNNPLLIRAPRQHKTIDTSQRKRKLVTLQSRAYDNCRLLAPDGQILSTCDLRKAQWYISKGLGVAESDAEPLSVRLNFEPAARGEEGEREFYVAPIRNVCVVCGAEQQKHHVRKCVVPREYRQYFPEMLKSHQSHDRLLVCLPCNIRCDAEALPLRRRLAEECEAPLERTLCEEYRENNQIGCLAYALLTTKTIPEERAAEMRSRLSAFFQVEMVDDQLLQRAASFKGGRNSKRYNPIKMEKSNFIPHGLRVLRHFERLHGSTQKAVVYLEQLWRQNFLDTMRPRCMPDHWAVDHRHPLLLLQIRAPSQ